jgi:type VI secretion system protein ImpL
MLKNIGSQGGALALGNLRARLNASWSTNVAGFCQQAITGRYPLVRGVTKDITPDDFGKFFGPNGLMDDFFAKNLAPYVDRSGGNWRWRTTGSVPLAIPLSVLKQFQLAAQIRDMFFPTGGTKPSLGFNITPLYVDAALSKVQLYIEGQSVAYSADTTPQAATILLPSGQNNDRVYFEATPQLRGDYTTAGPWAWFRMMDYGTLQTTAQGERYHLTFTLDGRKAIYQLDARSVINPFLRKQLLQFRCPVSL